MISGSNYGRKIFKQKSQNQKFQDRSQKQVRSLAESVISQKPQVRKRIQTERQVTKQNSKRFALIKLNQIKKDSSQNESSQVFSKQNGKIKISKKSCSQYHQKVNPHGFSSFPPPLTQLLPPILITSMITEMIVISLNFMQNYQAYIIFGVLGLILIPILYFWYLTTSISPTDSIQLQHLQFIKSPEKSQFSPQKYKYFCNLCKTCISQKSFHCNRCNRCVQYFDHHCKWLNNCIGSKNYVEFIQLVVWAQLFMIFFFVCNVVAITKICSQYDQLPGLLWYAVVMIVIGLVPFVSISMLLCLHLYLIIAKRSTIELILQNRKKNKIHPQGSNDSLFEKQSKQTPLPLESPPNSPPFGKESQIMKEINGKNSQNLMKFMNNLSNSLKLTKLSQKEKQQIRQNSNLERKISFKPTILKKSTLLVRGQFKSSTVKSNKVEIEHEQRKIVTIDDNVHQDMNQDISNDQCDDMQQTSKNLVSRLKFSTKKQLNQEPSQIRTAKSIQFDASISHTERIPNSSRKQHHPRKLEPLIRHQTQRKMSQKNKVQTTRKQNNQKQSRHEVFDLRNNKIDTILEKGKKNQKAQQNKNLSNTRLFRVLSIDNKRQQTS